MKCRHCQNALLQHTHNGQVRIRIKGPVTYWPDKNELFSTCFWCAQPVTLTAFLPVAYTQDAQAEA